MLMTVSAHPVYMDCVRINTLNMNVNVPTGSGDQTVQVSSTKVSLFELMKHLKKFYVTVTNNKFSIKNKIQLKIVKCKE